MSCNQVLEQIDKLLENLFMYHGDIDLHVEEERNEVNGSPTMVFQGEVAGYYFTNQ